MMRRLSFAFALVLLAGCAAHSGAASDPVTPAPVVPARPDLSGAWDFTVMLDDGPSAGSMTLQRNGDGFSGTITPQGTGTLTISSLVLTGQAILMTVQTPEGPVTFEGTLGTDGTTMSGIVNYHGGQKLSLTAQKRPAAP